MNTIDIGSVPNNEPCLQVGKVASNLLRAETYVYKEQLERAYPNARFVVKRNDHDFGIYYSVEAVKDEAGWEAESGCDIWDEAALETLIEIIPRYKELVV